MTDHKVLDLIKQADAAITAEDFDALMDFYADDAVLVVQPGQIARGKTQIRKAFVAIAQHFGNALTVKQGAAQVLEVADTTLVLMETQLFIGNTAAPIKRRATYVFRQTQTGDWICAIDNSYGTDLLNAS